MNEPPAGRPGRGPPALHVVPDHDAADQSSVHLGNRLRAVREQTGLSQEKAAGKAGITRNRLALLEKTRFPNPTLSTLLGLMRAYKLRSIEELLGPVPSARLVAAWPEEDWDAAGDEGSS
jgi:transcriptional regulator with XRE-family HTH domain